MSTNPYDDLFEKARGLPADEQQKLIEQLEELVRNRREDGHNKTLGKAMAEKGLIGIASGPSDLGINPDHMAGFGEDGNGN